MSIIFVTGGARSGKSSFAYQLAKKYKGQITYIATAHAGDEEMSERIEKHRRERPSHWKLIEEPDDIAGVLRKAKGSECIIIDCLTLLITNWLLGDGRNSGTMKNLAQAKACSCHVARGKENSCTVKLAAFLKAAKKLTSTVIIVSNEVGMGIVPENKLARLFRDICGRANQMAANTADEVYYLVSGIPIRIK